MQAYCRGDDPCEKSAVLVTAVTEFPAFSPSQKHLAKRPRIAPKLKKWTALLRCLCAVVSRGATAEVGDAFWDEFQRWRVDA